MATTEELLDLAKFQIEQQLALYSSIDAKASAVVGADAGFAGLLFGLNGSALAKDALGIPALAALAASVVCGVLALSMVRWWLGPWAARFYELHGRQASSTATVQLLSDLSYSARSNADVIAAKTVWWLLSASGLVLSVVLAMLVEVVRVYTVK